MKYLLTIILALSMISCAKEEAKQEVMLKEYTAEQFFNTNRVGGGMFSGDSKTLLYSSNESGISNLYEMDLETMKSTQLTKSTGDNYYPISYNKKSPGMVLFSADQGGNELNHLYTWSSKEGAIYDLTPGDKHKVAWMGWSGDMEYIYYQSNIRDPRAFDLYRLKGANQNNEAELIYKNEDAYSIMNISKDGKLITLSKSISTDQDELYLLDMKSKEMTKIDMGKGEYSSQFFTNDNSSLVFKTNAKSDFHQLFEYSIDSQEISEIYSTDWDVSYASKSKNEKYMIISVNEDAKTKMIIWNFKDRKAVDMPAIKDLDVAGVGFSDDEMHMRLTLNSSNSPSDIFVYNIESDKLTRITNSLNPEINQEDLAESEIVRYPSFDNLQIPAVYYKPKNASANNKVPAIVFVHGGPGGQSRAGYRPLVQFLVNHGYAVLMVNNRGSSGYGKEFYHLDDKNHGDGDLKDCIWGKKWLQTQEDIDSDKIGIAGGSYGGYMVMAAMTFAPEEFKVGVDIYGVTNWIRTLKSIPPWWESFRVSLYTELGDPNTSDSVRLKDISPLFHADKIVNPVMVIQGANDPRVLKIESDEIVEKARANGVPVEYLVFEDEGHGVSKRDNQIVYAKGILEFLKTHLK